MVTHRRAVDATILSLRERAFGSSGVVETAREYWTHYRNHGDAITQREPRDITVDALEGFIRRIRENKPENTGVRAAESTLTAILGRMAIDQRREITWEEMMKS